MDDRQVLIAQITDCHLVETGETLWGLVDTAAMLAAAVDHINAMTPRPDLVVCTGDLVNEGRAAQYDNAAAVLGRLAVPLVLVPGNHDDRTELRAHFPGLPAGGPDDRLDLVVDDLPVRVIGLDTTVPGQGGGRVTVEQMAWLDEVLAGAPDRPTIVFQHHPPFTTGIAWMDTQRLDDRELLADVLRRHPQVLLVAAGHLHRSITARVGGTVAMCVPSTGAQLALALDGTAYGYADEAPTVTVHRWTATEGLVTHTSVVNGPPTWLPPWAPTAAT